VPKRLFDLDDDLLKEAQREFGTTGVSDTVRAARRAGRRRRAGFPLRQGGHRVGVWRFAIDGGWPLVRGQHAGTRRMPLSKSGNIILMHQCCCCSRAWADARAGLSLAP
jgi:hypothetical protein